MRSTTPSRPKFFPDCVRFVRRLCQKYAWMSVAQIAPLGIIGSLIAYYLNNFISPLLLWFLLFPLFYGLACTLATPYLLARPESHQPTPASSGSSHPYQRFVLLFTLQAVLVVLPWGVLLTSIDAANSSTRPESAPMLGSGETNAEALLSTIGISILIGYPWLLMLYRALIPEILRVSIAQPTDRAVGRIGCAPILIAFGSTCLLLWVIIPILQVGRTVWEALIRVFIPDMWGSLLNYVSVALVVALVIPLIATLSLAPYYSLRMDETAPPNTPL